MNRRLAIIWCAVLGWAVTPCFGQAVQKLCLVCQVQNNGDGTFVYGALLCDGMSSGQWQYVVSQAHATNYGGCGSCCNPVPPHCIDPNAGVEPSSVKQTSMRQAFDHPFQFYMGKSANLDAADVAWRPKTMTVSEDSLVLVKTERVPGQPVWIDYNGKKAKLVTMELTVFNPPGTNPMSNQFGLGRVIGNAGNQPTATYEERALDGADGVWSVIKVTSGPATGRTYLLRKEGATPDEA